MSQKFQNKYRIESTRLKNWDYSWNATYFVTICTKNRECFFGHIKNGEMILNDLGQIVESEWIKTFDLRPDMNLFMGEYIVMPNHFHAIIWIGDNEYNTGGRDAMHCVSTTPKNQFGPQSKNLSSIIRGFKTGVTVGARCINPDFAWQARFHDHIIRDEISFYRISKCIQKQPIKLARGYLSSLVKSLNNEITE